MQGVGHFAFCSASNSSASQMPTVSFGGTLADNHLIVVTISPFLSRYSTETMFSGYNAQNVA